MKQAMRATILLSTAVFFILSAPRAAGAVAMTLTGPTNGPIVDGVYISPYTATVNGVVTSVICDDFATDVYFGYSWTANVTNLSSLNGETSSDITLKFDTPNSTPTGNAAQQQQQYTVAAYLATEIMQAQAANNVPAQADYSFALWYLFEPNAVTSWLAGYSDGSTTLAAAEADMQQAELATQGMTPGNYSNVTIFSSTPLAASQEYLSVAPVTMPEASAPVFLAIYLGALLASAFVFKRRLAFKR
jgi:hypothetical protein